MGIWRSVVDWFRACPLWVRAVGGGAGALLVAALFAVPLLARHVLASRCAERQLRCEVDSVRFGLGRIWLRDIRIEDESAGLIHAEIGSVQVRPVWLFRAGIRVFGGRVELRGSEQVLRARLRSLAGDSTREAGGSAGSSEGARPLEVMGVDVSLRDASSRRSVNAWGVRASRVEGGWALSTDLVKAARGRINARIRALEVVLGRSGADGARVLERLEAASGALEIELPSERAQVAVSELPSAPKGKKARGRAANGAATASASAGAKASATASAFAVVSAGASASAEVNGAAPSASEIAAKNATNATNAASADGERDESAKESAGLGWLLLRPILAEMTAPKFRASVVALTVEARRGEEALRFGPSRFGLSRDAQALLLELVPLPVGGRAEATPLSVRARLPLSEAGPELDLTGGPVSLSALGVREGDLGLIGVREARLEASLHASVAADLSAVDVSSQGLLENVRLRRAALAPNELSGIRLGWHFEGHFAGASEVDVKQAELSLGDVRLRLSGQVSRSAERTRVNLRAEVPQAACGALLSAVPHGMAPLLEAVRMEGTLSLKGGIEFDSEHLDATRITLDVQNQCRIGNVPPAISPNRFRDAWYREVKGADGLPMTIQSGPGSPDWTAYEEISPFLETAIVVCEDAGFFSHRGIDYRAIENSIRMNLEAGRFLRGGSTVSMQLAKNLYLSKEKTISRKFQEAVFTQLLEQELSKHELLELYLNVIEFGPGIYGIRQAARYYFSEEPRDLSLGQALYLASILPSPDTQHFAPDGRVRDGWASYLRKLMHIARKIKRITDDELAVALAEQVAFRKPSVSTAPLGGADDAADEPDDEAPREP